MSCDSPAISTLCLNLSNVALIPLPAQLRSDGLGRGRGGAEECLWRTLLVWHSDDQTKAHVKSQRKEMNAELCGFASLREKNSLSKTNS